MHMKIAKVKNYLIDHAPEIATAGCAVCMLTMKLAERHQSRLTMDHIVALKNDGIDDFEFFPGIGLVARRRDVE